MIIAVGSDHGGFSLKARVLLTIVTLGHDVVDCGADQEEPADDYPDFAERVAQAIQERRAERGVLLCGSGVGISVAASKFVGIRAAVCHDNYSARQGVEDDAMNVLCLGGRVISPDRAEELVTIFLDARFKALERFTRRLAKVERIERRTQG
jgi:ribose 5-phosphate isomerase B